MSNGSTVIIVVAVIVVILVLASVSLAQRRMRLQRTYGPEYDRVAAQRGGRLRADAELSERERRIRKLDIRPLQPAARQNYAAAWLTLQEGFVDSPQATVTEAYGLVTAVMRERGYPAADDFEQVAANLSVLYPRAVPQLRAAHELSTAAQAGQVPTEELRQAVLQYRDLLSDLIGEPIGQLASASRDRGRS